MGSKYRTAHSIPEDFPRILKDFAREILRNQPANVYVYGAEYFRRKQREIRQGGRGVLGMSGPEMEEYFFQLFQAGGGGAETLSKKQFKALLEDSDLGLTKKQIKLLYSEADQNDDGEINYAEFVNGAVTLLQTMAAREQARGEIADAEAEAAEMAYQYLIHGMTPDEIAAQLDDAWVMADKDGSGFLDAKECKKFLKELPLNLTRKERNMIMAEIEFDENGLISKDQFLPLAQAVMLEIVKQQFFNVEHDGSDFEAVLYDLLKRKDKDDTGLLKPSKVRSTLQEADLGLTKFQLYTIVAEAPMKGNKVMIDAFVPICCRMVKQILTPSPEEVALRNAALEQMQEEGLMIAGMGVGELQDRLLDFFRSYDADGSGYLEMAEFEQAITSGTSGTGIEFSPEQAQLLLIAADEDQDGRISYEEFMRVAIQLLEFYDRENRIKEFGQQEQQEGN